jgi:hypothetical protein
LSTLSIVVLSILASLFAILLITATSALIYTLVRQQRVTAAFEHFIDETVSNLTDISAANREAIAKSLADHSSTLSLLSKEISSTLETHRAQVDAQISKIRGEEISTAVKDFLSIVPKQTQVATRIERAVLLFTDLVKHLAGEYEISDSDIQRAQASGLGPESYAPAAPGERYVSRSRVAVGDSEALADEAADHTQSFDEGLQP